MTDKTKLIIEATALIVAAAIAIAWTVNAVPYGLLLLAWARFVVAAGPGQPASLRRAFYLLVLAMIFLCCGDHLLARINAALASAIYATLGFRRFGYSTYTMVWDSLVLIWWMFRMRSLRRRHGLL